MWLSVWSEVQIAYCPADVTASKSPSSLCLIEIQTGFTFMVPAYQVVLGKRPFLNW